MAAEEKLKELYKSQEPIIIEKGKGDKFATIYTGNSGVILRAEEIDLIADLVVERLREG